MARIKVTGYIDTEELSMDDLDLSHPMGLSSDGYERLNAELSNYMDDVDFVLEKP